MVKGARGIARRLNELVHQVTEKKKEHAHARLCVHTPTGRATPLASRLSSHTASPPPRGFGAVQATLCPSTCMLIEQSFAPSPSGSPLQFLTQ